MPLSPEDEEVAAQYRKMLSMGLPEGAVMQKMAMGGVPQHIQDSVLGGEDASSAVDDVSASIEPSTTDRRSSYNMESSNSLWEEVVEEDSVEEEVVDDDSEEYEEEFVEEEVEEVVEDSEDENPKEEPAEASQGESAGEEAESESEPEASASAGAVPVARGAPDPESTTGGDIEDQQEEFDDAPYQPPAYRAPQPAMIPMSATAEKPLPSPSKCWYWTFCFGFLIFIGGGAGAGYWLTTLGGDDVEVLNTMPRTFPPTEAPSASVSTEFDPVKGNCDLGSTPNPIDQCDCFGKITSIESDVEDRYLYNREYFIPEYVPDFNHDISSCEPRNQALVWVSSGNDTKLTDAERAQKFALATAFASLGGGQWKNNTKWLETDDVCTWYGVNCTDAKVTQLELSGNELVGTLPSELSILDKLQFLTVARNDVSGPLPVSLFSLKSLGTLDVSFNTITGAIPPAVEAATSLNSLNVESNAMVGRLTRSIGSVSNLRHLNVRSNGFLAEIPPELYDLENLKHLDIGDNEFTGTFPAGVSQLTNLEVLSLGPNLFTGTIPVGLSALVLLKYLTISGIEGLSGGIPAEFGFYLNDLEGLTVTETSVSGTIDTSFGRLPSLKTLNLSKNQLRSAIPSEFGNLANLTSLDLSMNFLDGQIPAAIGTLSTLKEMRLNDNLLQGGIPITFGNLVSLESLTLEGNRLEDRVADEICSLRGDMLDVFVVDCPVEVRGDSGVETFGVVCPVPECCTACVDQ